MRYVSTEIVGFCLTRAHDYVRMFEGSFSSSREGMVVTFAVLQRYLRRDLRRLTEALPMHVRLNYPFGFERFQLDEFMTRVGRQNAL